MQKVSEKSSRNKNNNSVYNHNNNDKRNKVQRGNKRWEQLSIKRG
jgi:hypothetical protein